MTSGAYHSSFNQEKDLRQVCGMAILPLKTKFRGPAPVQKDESKQDIVDEALDLYRANVLFRTYDVQGPGDRVLLYLTLYVSQCLQKIVNLDKDGARGALTGLAIENFAIPGDGNFALGGHFPAPSGRPDADLTRQYLTQLRQELGNRLVEPVYAANPRVASKWWTCFNKRKFLNKAL